MSAWERATSAMEAYASEQVLLAFQDFGRSAFGIDTSAMTIEQVKREIAVALASRPETRDFYGVAAKVAGVRPGKDVFKSRKDRCVLLRWGVWLALVDADWSYNSIAKDSTSLHEWDHSTIISGMTSLVNLRDEAYNGGVNATKSSRARERLAIVDAVAKAVRPMANVYVTACHVSMTPSAGPRQKTS